MPTYNLDGLGPHEFERMAQALVMQVIGPGSVIFGSGPDGAREATFSGRAPYPSKDERWDGSWIFQAKFHDTQLLGVNKARRQLVADVKRELDSIVNKYQHPCDNYIVLTNVPLTSVPGTGTRARLDEAHLKYADEIRNFAVWGADDIGRLLDKYPNVRTSYLHYIVPGDLIARLLQNETSKADEASRTIRSYITTSFGREQYAQLDQAGDVSDEPVRLQQVFFELTARARIENTATLRADALAEVFSSRGGQPICPVVRLMLSEAASQAVIIGGPGEGKSTVGQYLAQLHRATLLGKVKEIALNDTYLPATPRIPFRIILRDYGEWLSKAVEEDPASGALDEYICETVKALTSRPLDSSAFHDLVESNPTLFIFDGLDEVTDVALKKILMERLGEFVERCKGIGKANIQVFATSRPTRYMEQFDPKEYIYLRLTKLQPEQVTSYVKRWTEAKDFDPAKATRVLETIGECLSDPQIRLMATTPLQVTILAVIVALGGTPPRQREALFDEYLEVIYKRETAKGRHIIQSEKEQLIGLHKYVGYMLHEKATAARAMSALFPRADYETVVSDYLSFQNPYAPPEVLRAEHKAITRDAGDRLVLIVEPMEGKFGFELRSIQEFFAACHLLDTSRSTDQRYRRFEAISRLTHWRNVALFFAGRVGRNYSGEISNIVEVCRAVDREGPDKYLRRGSGLALELAAERAFGPNARGQRSLLEYGLLILESDLSPSRRAEACDLLQKLPADDIRDHLVTLLRQEIELLNPNRLENIAHAAHAIQQPSLVREALAKMAESNGSKAMCLRTLIALGPNGLSPAVSSVLELIEHSGADLTWQFLAGYPWNRFREVLDAIPPSETVNPVVRDVIARAVCHHRDLVSYGGNDEGLSTVPLEWGPEEMWPLVATDVVIATRGEIVRRESFHEYRSKAVVIDDIVARTVVPKAVREGRMQSDPSRSMGEYRFLLTQWIVHLWLGDVSVKSLTAFCQYYSAACNDLSVRQVLWEQRLVGVNPALDVLVSRLDAGLENGARVLEAVVQYAGLSGTQRWTKSCDDLVQSVDDDEWGPGSRSSSMARRLSALRLAAEESFPSLLVDHVLYEVFHVMPMVRRALGDGVEGFVQDGVLTVPRLPFWEPLLTGKPGGKDVGRLRSAALERILAANRPDGPELLSMLLPSVLAAARKGTDELISRAIEVVGRSPDPDRAYIRFPSALPDAAALRQLMNVAIRGGSDAHRRGGLRLLRRYCLRFFDMLNVRPGDIRRPRYKGFAEEHRLLVASSDAEARVVGLLLFVVRPPSSDEDFNLIADAVVAGWSAGVQFAFYAVLGSASRSSSAGMVGRWITQLSSWLELDLAADARAVIGDYLDRLLSSGEQSLERFHESLGLPLQT